MVTATHAGTRPPKRGKRWVDPPLRGHHVAAIRKAGAAAWTFAIITDDGHGNRAVRESETVHASIADAMRAGQAALEP